MMATEVGWSMHRWLMTSAKFARVAAMHLTLLPSNPVSFTRNPLTVNGTSNCYLSVSLLTVLGRVALI